MGFVEIFTIYTCIYIYICRFFGDLNGIEPWKICIVWDWLTRDSYGIIKLGAVHCQSMYERDIPFKSGILTKKYWTWPTVDGHKSCTTLDGGNPVNNDDNSPMSWCRWCFHPLYVRLQFVLNFPLPIYAALSQDGRFPHTLWPSEECQTRLQSMGWNTVFPLVFPIGSRLVSGGLHMELHLARMNWD